VQQQAEKRNIAAFRHAIEHTASSPSTKPWERNRGVEREKEEIEGKKDRKQGKRLR
jgi:hypothetical protein